MAKCRYCGKQVHQGKWQHERYCPENPDHMTAVGKAKEHRLSRFKLEGAEGIKSMWYFWNHCFLGRNRAYQPRKLKLEEGVRSTGILCQRCGRIGSLEYVDDALVFLFCWHEVPGKDEKRILDFLFNRYQMDMSGASIEKVGDSLKIITETHSVTLRLEQYWYEGCLKTRIYLRIDNGEEETHYAERVDGEINVYVKIEAVCRKCKSEIEAERLEGTREQIRIKNLLLADKFHDLLDECEKKGTCDILAAHHELLQNDDDRLRTSVLQDLICRNNYEDKWNEILDESKVNIESKRLEFKKRIVAEKENGKNDGVMECGREGA